MRSTPRRARRSPRSADDPPAAGPAAERIPLDRLPLTDGVVSLRTFEISDAAAVAEACRDPEIPRWTFMTEGLTELQARDWIERAHDMWLRARAVRFAIVDSKSGELLGQVGIGHLNWEQQVGEVFYWIAAPARRRGVATRAVKVVTAWAFETLELARVELVVDPANEPSQRVAAAAGFTREGLLRSYQRFKDRRMDAVIFARLPGDT